jgi:hypothetical protein
MQQLAAAEGQGQAVVTVEQLQYACCKTVVSTVQYAMATLSGESAGRAAMVAIQSRATAHMRRLQPDNPEAWVAAAMVSCVSEARSFELCGRALELGSQQGSLFPRAMAANQALDTFHELYRSGPPPTGLGSRHCAPGARCAGPPAR